MAKKRQPEGIGICDVCGGYQATYLPVKIFNPKGEQILEKCSNEKCHGHIDAVGDELPF